jgi:Hemerythrin HHE cation binding domain
MTLETRQGLPDALRILVRDYPRDLWESHHNFDALTRFWLDRHLGFRAMLADISRDTEGFLDGKTDPRHFAGLTVRSVGGLLRDLQGHHQIEDHHYFPLLSAAEPRLAHGFDLLDADHHALEGHIHGMADATNALLRHLAEASPGSTEAAAALLTRTGGFERFINRHLLDEEDLVVPVILHHAPDL